MRSSAGIIVGDGRIPQLLAVPAGRLPAGLGQTGDPQRLVSRGMATVWSLIEGAPEMGPGLRAAHRLSVRDPQRSGCSAVPAEAEWFSGRVRAAGSRSLRLP